MRRCLSVLLVALLLVGISACSAPASNPSFTFYYCTADISYIPGDSVIRTEARKLGNTRSDIVGITETYLKGPIDDDFTSPFPNGTSLLYVALDEDKVEVVLSNEFAELTGVDLTIACACLTMTLLDLTQVDSVQISAESATLGNQDFIVMDADSLIMLNEIIQ